MPRYDHDHKEMSMTTIPVPPNFPAPVLSQPVPAAIVDLAAKIGPLQAFPWAGAQRPYLLHLPPNVSAPVPLLVLLHGFDLPPAIQCVISQAIARADAQRVAVLLPQSSRTALGLLWQCTPAAPGSADDDIGFVNALVATVLSTQPIDRNRVALAGFSDGATMAYTLAERGAPWIRSLAIVSGTNPYWADHTLPRPLPLVDFHGTADPILFYTGGPYPTPAIPTICQAWANAVGGAAPPVTTSIPPDIQRSVWAGACPVELYTVAGGGHAWPGGLPLPYGPTTQTIDATTLIMQFLKDPQAQVGS
jgi:polyhydroxybutyrate depolymerase